MTSYNSVTSVKALMETQITDPHEWPNVVFSSSTINLFTEKTLLCLYQLCNVSPQVLLKTEHQK